MRGEILTGTDRRRRWSSEEKTQILKEAFAPGAVVTAVARLHDIRPQQIYQWRDAALSERNAKVVGDVEFEGFVPVTVKPATRDRAPMPAPQTCSTPAPACAEAIEIVLSGGRVLRLAASSSSRTLERVIRAVESA